MSKPVLLALTVPIGLLAGCTAKQPTFDEIDYPIMTLSQPSLEFGTAEWGGTVERTLVLANEGEMPMGVGTIVVNDADETSYSVTYNVANIECPEASADTGATAKGLSTDTGSGGGGDDSGGGGGESGGGGGGGGGGDDTGGGGLIESDALFVLDPGCQIPLTVTYAPTVQGDAYNALLIESVGTELTEAEEASGQELPDYLADPVHGRQVIYLHGDSTYEEGSILVSPRSYDFGFVHPDDASNIEPARIGIANVGDGDATILSVALAGTCDTAFSMPEPIDPNTVLAGGTSTLAEIYFTPEDTDPAYCQLEVITDDPANPEVDVTITANTGSDPENEPPTAYVRWPDNGYKYNAIRPLELELNIFDVNQPATSLTCRVKSAVIQNVTVADCDATDESGHVWVSIDPDDLESGIDTLLVTVTDGMETTAQASVSVVINADYPEDDDDGDGYSVNGDEDGLNPDCDDTNIYTYPEAAEIYDGQDNDCDETIDEGTIGFDDDGDGTSEVGGDCNDDNSDVFDGAPERGDGLDNDCDGVVDETTQLFDDDGDGYAEVNNDCDDDDDTVHPGAEELCDGIDNDCDGPRDSADGCVDTDADPIVVGNAIWMEQSACLEAEVIQMSVNVYDADADALTYAWTSSAESNPFDNMAAPTVNFTAPGISQDVANAGANVSIYATVTDADGGQDWAFAKIAVWDDKTELYEPFRRVITEESSGCSTSGGGAGLALAGLGLALVTRRRR